MKRAAVVALVLASGCYKRRAIVVPPGEHGRLCLKDAEMQWQLCMMQQRGKFVCDERQDNELLLCEGAFEALPGTDAGAAAEEVPTYSLPGYRP